MRQILQLLVEVAEARRGDAVGADAEVDLVEVQLEDLVLRVGAFDADGEDRLLQLALHRAFAAQQEVLGDLLGDGRTAFGAAVAALDLRFHDLVDGARDALEVDAAVLVEALVLSRKEGGDDALGNGVDGHEDAPLARVLGDQRAVVRVNARHDRRLVLRQALVVGKILRGLPQQVTGSARRADEQNAGGSEPEAQEAQEQALAPLASTRRRRVGRVDVLRRVLRRI